MAQAIRALEAKGPLSRLPLIGKSASGGPCDWTGLGLPLKRLTRTEFEAALGANWRGRYIEHIGLSRPTYSRLRLRAAVEVSHNYGTLGADGFLCTFRRGLGGWRLIACHQAWIS